MEAFRNFIEMGDYGSYVWPSYGLSAVILTGLVVTTLRRLRAREQELARRQAELPARQGRRQEHGQGHRDPSHGGSKGAPE